MSQTSIHCVSVGKHFRYLHYMLRSVEKFASGFIELVIMCPTVDRPEIERMAQTYHGSVPLWIHYFDEWSGKGFLHHEYLVMCAEQHCRGDFILHMDSDHIFTEPVMPVDYFQEDKPILIYHDFPALIREQPNLKNWQDNSERAFGFRDDYEFMRRAPLVHSREVYPVSRREIEAHVGQPLELFVRAQRNQFPQTFCEFQSIGSTAWRKFHERYCWIRQGWVGEQGVRAINNKLRQAWSNRPPTPEDLATYARLGL